MSHVNASFIRRWVNEHHLGGIHEKVQLSEVSGNSRAPTRLAALGWNPSLQTVPGGPLVFRAWSGRNGSLRVRKNHHLRAFPELNTSFLICETKWQKPAHGLAPALTFARGCKVLS